MPPPPTSPPYPQAPYSFSQPGARGHPPPSTFARDLQALQSGHRATSTSSMSISSMLDSSNADKQPREPTAVRGSGYTQIKSPANTSIPPPSPPQPQSRNGPPQETVYNRDGATGWHSDQNRPRAFSGEQFSPGLARFQSRSPSIVNPGHAGRNSQGDEMIQRPMTSESPHYENTQSYQARQQIGRNDRPSASSRYDHRSPAFEIEVDQRQQVSREPSNVSFRAYERPNRAEPFLQNADLRDGERRSSLGTERITSYDMDKRQPAGVNIYKSQSYESRQDNQNGPPGPSYHYQSQSVSQSTPSDRPNGNGATYTGETNAISGQTHTSPTRESVVVEGFQRLRNPNNPIPNEYKPGARQSPKQTPIRHVEAIENQRNRDSPQVSLPPEGLPRTPSTGQYSGVMDEHHRVTLGLPLENKRGGRHSPLPQAVQGAQSQKVGPASEPGIKSEFARMFSGIGSGVGSGIPTPTPGPAESGASLSFPSSPIRNDEQGRRTPFSGKGFVTELIKPRNTSRGGRRGRKVKDEDNKIDLVDGDDLRPVSGRGTKRSRPGHHHHSQQAGHQYVEHISDSEPGAN